jgi:hypothetical protein
LIIKAALAAGGASARAWLSLPPAPLPVGQPCLSRPCRILLHPFFSAILLAILLVGGLSRRSCNSSMSCSAVAFLERGFFMGLGRRDRHRSPSTSSRPLAADVARSRLLSRLARLRLRCAQGARAGGLDLPVRVNLHSAEEWRRGAELRLGARAFVLLQPSRDDVRGGMRGSLQ